MKKLRSSPRLQGIREQYKRASRFYKLAQRCKNSRTQFNNLIAAVYPAVSITQLILEAVEKQELNKYKHSDIKVSRNSLENEISSQLPYYLLLKKIRIHDFHRFGCLPPKINIKCGFLGGPIKLVTRNGSSAIKLIPNSFTYITTGDSEIKDQRPLFQQGESFIDENKKLISLSNLLSDYLKVVPEVIKKFEQYYNDK